MLNKTSMTLLIFISIIGLVLAIKIIFKRTGEKSQHNPRSNLVSDPPTGQRPENKNPSFPKPAAADLTGDVIKPVSSDNSQLEELEEILKVSYVTPRKFSITNLENITFLQYTGHCRTLMPESIGKLKNLETLFLWSNCLNSIPKSIGNLTNLENLCLKNNKIESLPKSIENLKNLKKLNLSNNNLKLIPESIGYLSNLKHLELSQNSNLKSIHKSIGNLKKLELLDLSYNKNLESIPESIANLTNLRVLHLDHNEKLKSIPESIGKLTNLHSLFLNNTNIQGLPRSIEALKGKKIFIMLNGKSIKKKSTDKEYGKDDIIRIFGEQAKFYK